MGIIPEYNLYVKSSTKLRAASSVECFARNLYCCDDDRLFGIQ